MEASGNADSFKIATGNPMTQRVAVNQTGSIIGGGRGDAAPCLARNRIARDGQTTLYRRTPQDRPIHPEFTHRLAAVLWAFQSLMRTRQKQFVGPNRVRARS